MNRKLTHKAVEFIWAGSWNERVHYIMIKASYDKTSIYLAVLTEPDNRMYILINA